MNPLLANVMGFIGATLWSFLGNWLWTFEKKADVSVSSQRFLVLSLACFATSELIVFVAVTKFAWPMWAAMLPVMLVVPGLSFLGSKYHAFR
jgi:putative flippase GtrA